MFDQVKIGISPLSWTNDDDPSLGGDIPFEQCIQEMQQAGYVGCEVGNKFPRDPEQLHAALDPLQLQVASAWFSTYFTVPGQEKKTIEDFARHMNFLKAMGCEVIVVCECGGSIQGTREAIFGNKKPVFSKKQWQQLVSGLHRMGEMSRDNGMTIVYHEHMGTGVQTVDELHDLMQHTDPEMVALLFDAGHIMLAGGDPTSVVVEHADRIKHVHLKDCRQPIIDRAQHEGMSFLTAIKEGLFTVPGDGDIDFKPIFQALSDVGYKGWFIVEAEQDPHKAEPLVYAKKGRRFIHEMTGL